MTETGDLLLYAVMLVWAVPAIGAGQAMAYGEYQHDRVGTLGWIWGGLAWSVVMGMILSIIWGLEA